MAELRRPEHAGEGGRVTPVCEISNGGITTYRWLCARDQSDRRGAGWTVKPTGGAAPWPCDDCLAAEQAAPGYVTPTLAFVPTSAGARCPTRAECPPPPPMKPWPAAERRKKGWKRVEDEILRPALANLESEDAA